MAKLTIYGKGANGAEIKAVLSGVDATNPIANLASSTVANGSDQFQLTMLIDGVDVDVERIEIVQIQRTEEDTTSER